MITVVVYNGLAGHVSLTTINHGDNLSGMDIVAVVGPVAIMRGDNNLHYDGSCKWCDGLVKRILSRTLLVGGRVKL